MQVKTPVKSIRIYLNDKLFYLEEYNFEITFNTIKNIKLKLANGLNKISIQFADKNNIKSKQIEHFINYKGTLISRNLYILALGNNEYLNLPKLKYAQKDASDFVNIFNSNNKVFDKIHIKSLYNDNLTKENLYSNLLDIKSKISPNDVMIFYFAGHGVYDSSYKISIYDELVSMDLIFNTLANFNSANMVLFIDACYSGQAINSIEEYSKYLRIAQNKINFNLYTSSFFEPSYEFNNIENGIFTHFALKCLSGSFTDNNGNIGTNELSYYLKDKYSKYIEETLARKSHPIIFNNGDNIILK